MFKSSNLFAFTFFTMCPAEDLKHQHPLSHSWLHSRYMDSKTKYLSFDFFFLSTHCGIFASHFALFDFDCRCWPENLLRKENNDCINLTRICDSSMFFIYFMLTDFFKIFLCLYFRILSSFLL